METYKDKKEYIDRRPYGEGGGGGVHRRGGWDSGGCELGIAATHLHKGQGSMPNGGKGWHHAFQTGREGRLERETERERGV